MWVEHDSGDELWIHGAVISTLSEKPISTAALANSKSSKMATVS